METDGVAEIAGVPEVDGTEMAGDRIDGWVAILACGPEVAAAVGEIVWSKSSRHVTADVPVEICGKEMVGLEGHPTARD